MRDHLLLDPGIPSRKLEMIGRGSLGWPRADPGIQRVRQGARNVVLCRSSRVALPLWYASVVGLVIA
jgi:hypothetical protein